MGIQASYWATGGILTILGLLVAKALLGFLGTIAMSIGGFLLMALAFFFKAALVLLVVWLVARALRRRRATA